MYLLHAYDLIIRGPDHEAVIWMWHVNRTLRPGMFAVASWLLLQARINSAVHLNLLFSGPNLKQTSE